VLASVARGEHAHARLPAHLDAAGVGEDARMTLPLEPRGDSDSQARTEFAAGWRRVGSMLGVARAELERFVGVAQGVRAAWSRERATPRWHGCYRDRPGDRAMSGGPRTFGHTTQACAAACTGYAYLALQAGQCFCARSLPKGGNFTKVADAKCGPVCAAEEGKKPPRLCGASWRLAVYSNPTGQ